MSSGPDITRDGFKSAFGRFYTEQGRIERMSGASLRSMFLLKLTRDGQKALRDHHGFVRGQLQHYNVHFDEHELTGNGTHLMKKVLQQGRCDTVPAHMLELEAQLHREWLSHHKYFRSEEHTASVVGIPFPRSSEYRVSQLQAAAGKVAGLYHETATGPTTKTAFLGWDKDAVHTEAQEHAGKERKEVQAVEHKRQTERARLHTDYCRQAQKPSPVGSYIVDCKDIEEQWPDLAKSMSLDIEETYRPGVFSAEYHFGVLEGVMVICADEGVLEQYCSEEDDDSDDGNKDEPPKAGPKRNASAARPDGASKKSKKSPLRTYLLKMRGRETGEGEIMNASDTGIITFKDAKLFSFMGKVSMPCVGEGVVFTARKVSDTPSVGREWSAYSERQYGIERVNRWR